jgi:hypothetical protein
MVDRRVFFSVEFDFLAVDDDDHVAVFSSAGYGPLPLAVLDQPELEQEAVEATELLPIVSNIKDAPIGGGDYHFWLARVERGLFAYDWENTYGPYQRVAIPETPAALGAMKPIRSRLGALPRLPTSFLDSEFVDLASLGVELSLAADPRML